MKRSYDFSKWTGIQPAVREALNWAWENGGLPLIKNRWFFVDPENGTATAGGGADSPVNSIETAYALCTDGAGDGIILLSGGTSTADTTSYIDETLVWAKDAITVVGIAAPTRMYGRARVANVTRTTGSITTIAFPTATTITDSAEGFLTAGFEVGQTINIDATDNTNDGEAIITAVTAGTITCAASTFTVQTAAVAGATVIRTYVVDLLHLAGDNNAFYNVHIANFGDSVLELGGVKISGNRNYFGNCHLIGGGNATPGAETGAYSLKLDGCEELTFDGGTIGTDTVLKAAANGELLIDGGAKRICFNGTSFVTYSATAGKGAVKSADATSFQGIAQFNGCKFLNWNENGITAVDDVFIGTAPTSGAYAVTPDSMCVGFTGWGEKVYVAGAAAAASAGGQIATIE